MQVTTPQDDDLSRRERQIALAYADGHHELTLSGIGQRDRMLRNPRPDVVGTAERMPRNAHAYDESLAIMRDLTRRAPDNAGWARDVSVGVSRVGDVRLADGDRAAALAAYDKGLAIMRDLARRNPRLGDS